MIHASTGAALSAAARLLPATARTLRQSAIRSMTERVLRRGGVNLGQGSCLLPADPDLLAAAAAAMAAGENSYTPCEGIPELRDAVAAKYARHNGLSIGAEHVLVTAGASGALESGLRTFLRPGDEVIVFAPFYPYHVAAVRDLSAVVNSVALDGHGWRLLADRLAAAISPRTRIILFANPGNPTGRVFTREELETVADVCRRRDLIAIVDEVYEYLTYDGSCHVSLASLPGMFERTLTLSSAGKTFFVTGWRVGWMVAPADVVERVAVHADRIYVCAPAPLQRAVAAGLGFPDAFFAEQRAKLDRRRRALLAALTAAGLDPLRPEGAYYVLARLNPALDDEAAAEELLDRTGVGSVPGSAFVDGRKATGFSRLCFAVDDTMLDAACRALAAPVKAPLAD
ncbi:MAG: pyridoxal phosphate-dependent aminotransferase [Vicinamibacterales bacterium]